MARGQLRIESPDDPNANTEADELSAALAGLGLYCESSLVIDEDEFWLWPENEEAFWLWCSVQTQWMVGMAGALGLNYPGVESCMRMRGIRKKRQRQLFLVLQMMEQATLEEWASKRK